MKISQILNSIIIGIAAGAQPIFGYNYGAGKFDRVKKTLKNSTRIKCYNKYICIYIVSNNTR